MSLFEKKIVLLGAGGLAREILDIFEQLGRSGDVMGYLVDTGYGEPGSLVNGKPILGDFGWLKGNAGKVALLCAVGDPEVKLRFVETAQSMGGRFQSLIHPSAVVSASAKMEEGVIVAAGSFVSCQTKIGRHALMNVHCVVGHDVELGDFCTVGPGAVLCGGVSAGTGASIGTAANVLPRVRVGEWSRVGIGSAVIKDVPPNSTVVGTPARLLAQKEAGWHLQRSHGGES